MNWLKSEPTHPVISETNFFYPLRLVSPFLPPPPPPPQTAHCFLCFVIWSGLNLALATTSSSSSTKHTASVFVIWSGLSHNLLTGIRLVSTLLSPQSPIHLASGILLVASFRGADIASATYLYKFSNSYSQFLHQILVASFRGADSASATYLYKASNSYSQFFHQILLVPLSEVPTSLQQLTFTSFPTHILNFFIISYLSPLSEVPTSLQQLTFTSFPTHILNFLHHILPLFRSFIPYSSFLSRLFSLYLSPLVPSFITYSSSFNSRLFSPKRKLLAERNLYRRVPAN